MSDERRGEFMEEDFGGDDEVRENEVGEGEQKEEDDESDAENEMIEGEQFEEEEGSNSVENHGGMMPTDRLSQLPDSLLIIHVLTRLDMKKAATTGVLSKRWQYLWTELPKLSFHERSTDIEKTRKFVTRVHRVLVFRSVNFLDEFKIDFVYDKCFASDVNVWVEYAVRNKVKQLHLELQSCRGSFYMLPQVMYSCSSLTWLSMQWCILAPKRTINWQSLTTLSIEGVELQEHVIQKLLSGCPVLSSLDLRACWGFECLDIASQSLHNLVIAECEDEVTGTLLQISAPYIRFFDIGFFPIGRKKLRFTNIQSVVTACIHFDVFDVNDISEEEMNDAKEVFEDTKHARELFLNYHCIEVLSKLAANGWQLPQSSRECLSVEPYENENSILSIVSLLESSPNLEKLVIQCWAFYEESNRSWGPVARDYLNYDLLHLKTVLIDCGGPNITGEPMLTLARILLKRATALEKMVVVALGSLTKYMSFFVKIVVELLSYPRSSREAVVVLRRCSC